MGLAETISTLEAQYAGPQTTQDIGQQLALALAKMIGRKGSKRLVWSYFDDLARVMESLARYDELVEAAGGVDPGSLGVWDCQEAVAAWLESQAR